MKVQEKSKPRTAASTRKKTNAKSQKSSSELLGEYTKYFVPPQTTPDAFRIFDMTDETSISYSSHT